MFSCNLEVPVKTKLNIAVIGSGIAGMSAAWILNGTHNVTIYEKNSQPGGHSNTVLIPDEDSCIAVDTGFIVYNEVNYPNLTKLFDYIEVPTVQSEMSFSVSDSATKFEYGGSSLNSLFAQRRNLIRPKFWAMIKDILRFYRAAPRDLESGSLGNITLGDYLYAMNYGDEFIYQHILPMGAAIWSSSVSQITNYPAQLFVKFFLNHGLLSIRNRPKWRTVSGGSRNYVERLTAPFVGALKFNEVIGVSRGKQKVEIYDKSGDKNEFDHVIFATHADSILGLMSDSDLREQKAFLSWRYSANRVVLHTDSRLMPNNRRAWASWNFMSSHQDHHKSEVCVTYWMNSLQSLKTDKSFFVTLNPPVGIDISGVIKEFIYKHPLFDNTALQAQSEIRSIQGYRNTWYCGSYMGYGFHEDALTSGLEAAKLLAHMGPPWQNSMNSLDSVATKMAFR